MTKDQSMLLVDGDQMFRSFIRNEMLLRGYKHIQLAANTMEAMQLASRQYFDTVIIDLFMSNLSSLQLANYLKQKNTDTQIVLLLKEEYQPILDREFDFPVTLKKNLLFQLLHDD